MELMFLPFWVTVWVDYSLKRVLYILMIRRKKREERKEKGDLSHLVAGLESFTKAHWELRVQTALQETPPWITEPGIFIK